MVDEPHGEIWGGVVAAPIFRDIARFALQYLEVPPDAPETKRSLRCSPALGRRCRGSANAPVDARGEIRSLARTIAPWSSTR